MNNLNSSNILPKNVIENFERVNSDKRAIYLGISPLVPFFITQSSSILNNWLESQTGRRRNLTYLKITNLAIPSLYRIIISKLLVCRFVFELKVNVLYFWQFMIFFYGKTIEFLVTGIYFSVNKKFIQGLKWFLFISTSGCSK